MAVHQFTTIPNLTCYVRGCRCADCRQIYSAYIKAYRQRTFKPTGRPVGRPRKFATEKERARAYFKEYRKTAAYKKYRRSRRTADNKLYRERYPEKAKMQMRQYRARHADKIRERERRYSRTPKGKVISILKRTRRRSALGAVTPLQLAGRWAFYGNRCYLCGDVATSTDHVIPIARGGTNWPSNLRPACRSCNSRKQKMTLSEYLAYRAGSP